MTRPEKITPKNIKQHLNDTANEHRGFGWTMFTLCYNLNINDSAAARLFNVHPRTMKNYKSIETTRRSEKRDEDNQAVEDYSKD